MDSELLRLQNRIRGEIGASRVQNTLQKRSLGKTRRSIRRILSDARSILRSDEYSFFFNWTNEQLDNQLPAIADYRESFEDFGLLPKLPPGSLEREIKYAVERLSLCTAQITAQLECKRLFEAALLANEINLLEPLLTQMSDAYGQSLWIIEASIATKQLLHGLEQQKQYIAGIGKAAHRRQAEFLAYYMGVRNEPNVSPGRFAREFEETVQATKFSASVKLYLLYKIAGLMPENEERFADIIQVEQGSSDFDLYETVITVCQYLVANDPTSERVVFALSHLKLLDQIGDHRLVQLQNLSSGLLNGSSSNYVSPGTSSGLEMLLEGFPKTALRHSLRKRLQADASELVAGSICLAILSPIPSRPKPTKAFNARLIRSLSNCVSMGSDYDQSISELQKTFANWSFLSAINALRFFTLCQISRKEGVNDSLLRMRYLESCSSDSRSCLGFLESIAVNSNQLKVVNHPSPSEQLLQTLNDPTTTVPANFPVILQIVIAALRLIRAEDLGNPVIRAAFSDLSVPKVLARRCAVEWVDQLVSAGQFSDAVSCIADFVICRGTSSSVFPLGSLSGKDSWSRLKHSTKNIEVPIVFDLVWRETSDDRDATNRRFAVQQFLSRNGLDKPSDLSRIVDQFPKPLLVYFLRETCAPTVLDMLPALTGSSSVDEERQSICRLLLEIDQENSSVYEDELLLLDHQRVVRSGLRIVDSSRIYVDEDAILKWAVKELKEPFLRYSDLINAGVGVAENYDALLRGILKPEELNKSYFEIPQSEADDILVSMVRKLSERFVYDAEHGLDSFLSKRVRHESLTSYLRNPVEKQNLITQRNSGTGTYEPNYYWLERFEFLSIEERREIDNHLRRFSEDFDRLLVSLRSEFFHIYSKEKPNGLFEMSVSAPMLHLLRSVVQQRLEIEDFAKTCLAFFWVSLNSSLVRARDHLKISTKERLAHLFETLRANLYSHLANSDEVARLSAAVVSASASVQAEIDNVAEWFVRTEVTEGLHRYTPRQAIEVSVESALKGVRNFEPEITILSDGDFQISAGDLIIFADIFRVALGNVKAHANKVRGRPKVDISLNENFNEETISFRIVSDIGPHVRTAENEKRLDEIRTDIAAKTYTKKIREEGGSGLRKLAAIIHQSKKGDIQFGFVDNDKFSLELTLSFILPPSAEVAE